MKTFVIAMESEARPVIEAMQVENEYLYCEKRVVKGKLYGQDVAVVICGVGKVNAASGTQYAIDILKADIIVNLGVAGGLNKNMRVGQTYSVSAAVQYDFDLVQLNHTEIGTLDEYKENYLPLSVAGGYKTAKVGTGDRFNDSREDFLLLTGKLGADIREMELGAIAQVCRHAGVKCYSFKTISDVAGSGSTTEQFLKNVETCLVSIAGELENIVKCTV